MEHYVLFNQTKKTDFKAKPILFSSDVGDYEFTSLSTVAELRFDVVNMTASDDFRSFGFEASVEFVRLEAGCESSHRVYGASGEMRLASSNPMSESVRILT